MIKKIIIKFIIILICLIPNISFAEMRDYVKVTVKTLEIRSDNPLPSPTTLEIRSDTPISQPVTLCLVQSDHVSINDEFNTELMCYEEDAILVGGHDWIPLLAEGQYKELQPSGQNAVKADLFICKKCNLIRRHCAGIDYWRIK